jgi:hypothetical protein
MIFVESPWFWMLSGLAIEAALAIALLRSQRGSLIWAMLGVAVLTLAGLGLERFVVTDREAVAMTLDAGAAAAEANDLNRLLACIAPDAQKPRNFARWVLSQATLQEARVRDLEVSINRLTSPPTARARFMAVGRGRDRAGQLPYEVFARQVTVTLRQEGNRWLATDFTIEDFGPQRP